jgi:Fe-S-cluster containining protein
MCADRIEQQREASPRVVVSGAPAASEENPCIACGACCAIYRVSFYWAEAEALGLPEHLVEQLTPFYACMAGTNQPRSRCQALTGEIGAAVGCSVYGQRPPACREVLPGDEKCVAARQHHGLLPLPR